METVYVVFEKVSSDAKLPTKGSIESACLDLYASEEATVRLGKVTMVSTGLKIRIPPGYMGHIVPRSGLAVKKGFMVMAGIIDSDYRGELKVVLTSAHEHAHHKVNVGERIAQLLIIPNPNVHALEGIVDVDTERGHGGFGSTGE